MMGKESQETHLIFARPVKGYWIIFFKTLFAIVTIVVIHESLIPSYGPTVHDSLDKLVHFAAYFILVCLAALAFPKARLWRVVGALILLGAALEGAQGLMNLGRTASVGDLIANGLGACFPAVSWIGCIRFISSRYR